MANKTRKGFRWHHNLTGVGPQIEWIQVASGYSSAIYEGGIITQVETGHAELCAAGTNLILGVVATIGMYWDGSRMVHSLIASPKSLPASTTYGSVIDRESWIGYYPAVGNVFEADLDEALTTATRVGALAVQGSMTDHVVSTDDTALDLSLLETTDTTPAAEQWRLSTLVETPDVDFTASRLKYLVTCNQPQIVAASTGL